MLIKRDAAVHVAAIEIYIIWIENEKKQNENKKKQNNIKNKIQQQSEYMNCIVIYTYIQNIIERNQYWEMNKM